jgi:hypothetical protein
MKSLKAVVEICNQIKITKEEIDNVNIPSKFDDIDLTSLKCSPSFSKNS